MMRRERVARYRAWFQDYVSGFYTGDPDHDRMIRLKQDHTGRVCENIQALGRAIRMPEDDLALLDMAALFHDIGRFRQMDEYGTFDDNQSENHARLGLRVLNTARILTDLDLETRRLILVPISRHNAYQVADIPHHRERLFTRLLRDADKLDIYQVVSGYYRNQTRQSAHTVLLGLPDRGNHFSDAIVADIMNSRLARMDQVTCLTDLKLLQISWVFDLNFPYSFQRLKASGVIRQIAATLPEVPQIQAALAHVTAYITFRVK